MMSDARSSALATTVTATPTACAGTAMIVRVLAIVGLATILFAASGGCSGDDAKGASSGATCAGACAKCSVADICQDCAGWGMRMRDEVENALYACVMEADACSHDWEVCISSAITAAPSRDLDRTFRDACLARRTECQNQGMGFADDLCLTSGVFIADLVTQAQQCLAKACNEVAACIHDAF